jgi:hypothetical protein
MKEMRRSAFFSFCLILITVEVATSRNDRILFPYSKLTVKTMHMSLRPSSMILVKQEIQPLVITATLRILDSFSQVCFSLLLT